MEVKWICMTVACVFASLFAAMSVSEYARFKFSAECKIEAFKQTTDFEKIEKICK